MIDTTPQFLAQVLDSALLGAHEMERLTNKQPDMTLIDAYGIQAEGISLREARGENRIGFKLGFTSKAKMEQMGLYSPIYGILTDKMQVQNEGHFPLTGTIHPKIEPEIVFRLGKNLKGKVTQHDVLQALDGVTAGLEILDSRYVGFKYFSLPDVVADNCSSRAFVVGSQWHDPRTVNLDSLKMVITADDQTVHEASSSAILGNPLESVVQLCAMLHDSGLFIRAGSIVFAGAATQAISLTRDMKVSATVEKLGTVTVWAV